MIERLSVTEGFLHGADVRFGKGLNVIIGPRGTGKTSVLELLRFGLGVEPLTSAGRQASERQQRAVLGGGDLCAIVSGMDALHDQSRDERLLTSSEVAELLGVIVGLDVSTSDRAILDVRSCDEFEPHCARGSAERRN